MKPFCKLLHVILLLSFIIIMNCAHPISQENLILNTHNWNFKQLSKTLKVTKVIGNQFVDSLSIKNALIQSIKQSKLFDYVTDSGTTDYELSVIVDSKYSQIGDFSPALTTSHRITYTINDISNGEVIQNQNIFTIATVNSGSLNLRYSLSAEKAMRDNIKLFLIGWIFSHHNSRSEDDYLTNFKAFLQCNYKSSELLYLLKILQDGWDFNGASPYYRNESGFFKFFADVSYIQTNHLNQDRESFLNSSNEIIKAYNSISYRYEDESIESIYLRNNLIRIIEAIIENDRIEFFGENNSHLDILKKPLDFLIKELEYSKNQNLLMNIVEMSLISDNFKNSISKKLTNENITVDTKITLLRGMADWNHLWVYSETKKNYYEKISNDNYYSVYAKIIAKSIINNYNSASDEVTNLLSILQNESNIEIKNLALKILKKQNKI